MNLVQNLIKKAFSTTNVNEAASFLASACNRMKFKNKEQIIQDVSTALANVSLARTRSDTLYQDSPKTLQRLRIAEARAAHLLSQLREEQQKNQQPSAAPNEHPGIVDQLRKFEIQVTELKKALHTSQEMHFKESALVRSVMQREIDKLQGQFNRYKAVTLAEANTQQQERAALLQRLTAADMLIKTQHEGRLRAEEEMVILHEKIQQLQAMLPPSPEQNVGLHARIAKTIDELSTTRNMLSTHLEKWQLNK